MKRCKVRPVMAAIYVLMGFLLVMGLGLSSLVSDADAGKKCYVQIKIKSGSHDVKVDGQSFNDLGPGRYTLDCKCMAPSVWVDGQMIALYPNQLYGNVYKVKVGR